MDFKLFLTIFGTVFLAELGDKTQFATMLFATDRSTSRLTVFLAASLALAAATAIGVLAGHLLSQYVSEKLLHFIAGGGFLVIGGVLVFKALA
jgi:putative Ca2+/H+ antiporter (TMEM165/GDT1 family)